MKVHERYLWIAAVILCGFIIQAQSSKRESLQILLETYQLESNIQDAQIADFGQQLLATKDASYQVGFEAGRTQASSVLADGDTLYNYSDGYHAAIAQNHLFVDSQYIKLLEQLGEDISAMLKENPPDSDAPPPAEEASPISTPFPPLSKTGEEEKN